MKNKEYWEKRAILKDKLLEKDIKKIEKKLLKLVKDYLHRHRSNRVCKISNRFASNKY